MIDCVYYTDTVRCYRDGKVERWFRNKGWKTVKNTANSGNEYNMIRVKGKIILRHRLIAFCFLGLENIREIKSGDDVIDHINGNPLTNCVSNLRITNQNGNQQNRKTAKGYNFNKASGKYEAQIMINNKKIHLGYYHTTEQARQAYLVGKQKYHMW